jgi:hypothetical protein
MFLSCGDHFSNAFTNQSSNSLLICFNQSPEDQATLEAEYKRNPKPDKAARIEIVKKISLGEKEVQVWQGSNDFTLWEILCASSMWRI